MELNNGLKLLDLERDTLQDVVLKFNHNMNLLLSLRDPLAGPGLVLDGRTLKLDVPKTFVTDTSGNLISLSSTLTVNDAGAVSEPKTLQEFINYFGAQLKAIKGTAAWDGALPESIAQVMQRVATLVSDYYRLTQEVRQLQVALETLTQKYEQLVDYYHSHKHKAEDVTSGIFNPRRLGRGEPTADKKLRGDGLWA